MQTFSEAYKFMVIFLSIIFLIVLTYFISYSFTEYPILNCKLSELNNSAQCYSCGITRGVSEILNGNIQNGLLLNNNSFLCLTFVVSNILVRLPYLLKVSISKKHVLFFEIKLILIILLLNYIICYHALQ